MLTTQTPGLWMGLKSLVAKIRGARYWTDRRDACEEIHHLARHAVLLLREAAQDKDPDITHWGKQACDQLGRDLHAEPADLGAQLGNELEEILREGAEGPPPAADRSAPASESRTVEMARTPEELIGWLEDFSRRNNSTFERTTGGAQWVIPVEDGRHQRVHLDLSGADSRGRKVAHFYSVCGAARESDFQWALVANSSLSRGSFGIIEHGGRNVLIMRLRRAIDDLPLATLEKKLLYLARKADWAESRLSERDRL